MIQHRPVAIVSASPLVHAAWRDAVTGAEVFAVDRAPAQLQVDGGVLVLDLPVVGQVREVLRDRGPVQAMRCIWIHGDIGPDDVRVARRWGVTDTVHRSTGLGPVLALVAQGAEGEDRPRASVLGRIRDPEVIARLTRDEVQLLSALGAGSTVAELRALTGWSRHEVERLRVSALSKLGVHTTGQALAVIRLSEGDAGPASGTP